MTPSPAPTQPRGIGKIIALVCAGGSLTCAFLALGLALWFWMSHGAAHVYTASLFAASFFFFSAAVVLHAMSKPQPLLPQENNPCPPFSSIRCSPSASAPCSRSPASRDSPCRCGGR